MNKDKFLQETDKRAYWLSNCIVILITGFCLCIAYFSPLTLAYAEPLQIAVMPFEINAEQNLDFLKKGIQDMLASRLSFKDVKVIEKESVQKAADSTKGFTGESLALLVGGKLKADFVIHGSITIIGNSTSIDSKLVDITGKNPPISFFRQTADPGGVIPAINQFATTINETVFNRSSGTATAVSQQPIQPNTGASVSAAASATHISQVASMPLTAGQQLNSSFIINQSSASQSSVQLQNAGSAQSPNPEFAVINNVRGKSGAWKSPTFKHVINGIAVGNSDKDNLTETVSISDHSVFIYRVSGNSFIKTAETEKNRQSTYIGVDVGDINANGIEEIFVTGMNPDRNMLTSFVMEYDGSKYVSIVKNTPWYFRIIETKGEGKMLLGQKSEKNSICKSPIYKMKWDGKNYVPAEKILESDRANVLSAFLDDVTGDGSKTVMAYDKAEHLTLFSQNGSVLWRDVNRSGGNINFFNLPKESPTDDPSIQYFPLSVRSADINSDGNIEVLYASNTDITGGYLSKFKRFSKGIIHCAFWNSSGLSLQWSTPEQTGRISDFVIGDFDNDGVKELVISNITKDTLSTFTDSESLITAYELMQ